MEVKDTSELQTPSESAITEKITGIFNKDQSNSSSRSDSDNEKDGLGSFNIPVATVTEDVSTNMEEEGIIAPTDMEDTHEAEKFMEIKDTTEVETPSELAMG